MFGGALGMDPFSAQSLLGGSGALSSTAGGLNFLGGGVGGSGSSAASGITQFLKDNKTALGGLLGAAAGGQDQTVSSNKDPWGPAQPYLRGLLDVGSKMYGDRIDNPLTEQQKQAYGNLLGIVNGANSAAPSLFAGMTANASGANNYQRKRT